jgi:hypothetical protein
MKRLFPLMAALLSPLFLVNFAQAGFFHDNYFDGSDLAVFANSNGSASSQPNYKEV